MNRYGRALACLLAVLALTACAAPIMLEEVPRRDPTPIDGLWMSSALGAKVYIREGRAWAAQPVLGARQDQILVLNFQRVGPRKFKGWSPIWAGPFYYTLQEDGSLTSVLQTAAWGDAPDRLTPIEPDSLEALTAEAQLAPPHPSDWPPARAPAANLAAAGASQPTTGTAKAAPPTPPAPPRGDVSGAVPVPANLSFGRYHALLIGNDAYQTLPRLRSAGADVRAIEGLLRDRYGFETRVLVNATRDQVLLALEHYRGVLDSNDNLLVYYAGHGWLDEEADEGYWLPVDANRDSSINWIPNSTLTSSFKALRAKHVLVVADSCYSGKLTRGIKIRGPETSNYLERMAAKRARIVLASGGLEPVLDGGGGEHSVFAAAFLRALRENEGVLETSALFSTVRREVMLGADQTPELADIRKADHQGGDFFFVPR